MPMVRFAVDPVLKAKEGGDLIATSQKVSEITDKPVRVDFTYKQKDAWYESDVTETAWVYKDDAGEIVALLIQSYELSVYCLFIPVSVALVKSRGHSISAWSAFACGALGFCLTRFISFGMIPKEVLCLLLSGSGYALAEGWLRWKGDTLAKETR